MSRSKDKGTAWESAVVSAYRSAGVVHAERRALRGSDDRGDVAGIPGVVTECKAEVKLDLAGNVAELTAEMANDGAAIGCAWLKRKGKTDPMCGYIVTTPHVWLRLLADGGHIAAPTAREG